MNISNKLKQARISENLTQEVVAEKIGVSRQTISNWENAKTYPDISSVILLSDIYGMTLDSLLKGDDEMINHLKESTNITKSNKQLARSIIFAGIFCILFVLIRIFVDIPQISGTIPNILAILVFAMGLIVVFAGSVNIKKIAEQSTPNGILIKIGSVILYALIYFPLILIVPEMISSYFQIQVNWIREVVKSSTAIILLIPGLLIYRPSNNTH